MGPAQNSPMSTLRRLVSLCLMLAFASYGNVMAAPVHAHQPNEAHDSALHLIATDGHHHDHHDADHGHDHDDFDDADESVPADSDGEDSSHHGGFHVHSVAAFTMVDEPASIYQPATSSPMERVERSRVSVSGLSYPLKKPPRTFL